MSEGIEKSQEKDGGWEGGLWTPGARSWRDDKNIICQELADLRQGYRDLLDKVTMLEKQVRSLKANEQTTGGQSKQYYQDATDPPTWDNVDDKSAKSLVLDMEPKK